MIDSTKQIRAVDKMIFNPKLRATWGIGEEISSDDQFHIACSVAKRLRRMLKNKTERADTAENLKLTQQAIHAWKAKR